ncbi:MAG: glycosyltransferase family 9 protein [Bacteroidetes bacterium]|nr:glycosyltransferase family 9 protein [Bacteroidota bacterium]
MHRCNPAAQLDVLVRKGNEGLLQNFPGLNQVLIWDKGKSKHKNLVRLLVQIRKKKYDIVINIQRFAATGILTGLSGAKTRIGFDKNPFSFLFTQKIEHSIDGSNAIHETQRNLKLIESFGANLNAKPVLFPSTDDFEAVKIYKTNSYYCIAPTSVWFTKQVPAVKWVELIKQIQFIDSNAHIYLLGGPADKEECFKIEKQSNHPKVKTLAGQLSFLQTAALMKEATRNFVNDSAPMHIASAMNAPITVYYCSTIPAFGFGPLSDDRKIIEVQNLYCRPCGLHGHRACPEEHFKCGFELKMDSIN